MEWAKKLTLTLFDWIIFFLACPQHAPEHCPIQERFDHCPTLVRGFRPATLPRKKMLPETALILTTSIQSVKLSLNKLFSLNFRAKV